MAAKKPVKKAAVKSRPSNKKTSVKQETVLKSSSRVRKLNRRAKKKEAKKTARSVALPSSWSILKLSLKNLYSHKRLFIGILLTYGILNLLFVKGFDANFPLAGLRQDLADSFDSTGGRFGTGVTLFGMLLGTSASTNNDAAGAYQSSLVVLTSLALIWALRKTYSGTGGFRIRDAFYKSMQSLVPFILVGLVFILQLVPFLIAAAVYSSVQSGALAVTGVEQLLWAALLVLGAGVTLFFTSSSIFALYIVTLPDSQPYASLKAARKLVRLRRIKVIRKILFLPLFLFVAAAVILIPLIIFIAPAAEITFLIFTMILLGVVHSYYYTLYRSLI